MREVALEVHLILLTIGRVMQEGIGIVEDVPFGDGVIAVVGSEFRSNKSAEHENPCDFCHTCF